MADPGRPVVLPVVRGRASPFAYACAGCGRCCHHKAIRVGPYEVARLADALGTTTTEVLGRYVDGAVLRTTGPDRACVFLDGASCSVHPGRPLACRLYPLGRVVGSGGGEAFVELPAHPGAEGTYGGPGTVADHLRAQGTAPYERAAGRYAEVLRRMEGALDSGAEVGPPPPVLDVDAAVGAECAARGAPIPDDVEDRVDLHLAVLHRWLDGAGAPA